jgi:hypothetical protein
VLVSRSSFRGKDIDAINIHRSIAGCHDFRLSRGINRIHARQRYACLR